jgi:hypothetical protein
MSDIDKKILSYTRDFVRWADDLRIFFSTREEAEWVLHEVTHASFTAITVSCYRARRLALFP